MASTQVPHPLDHVVWYALTTSQRHLAVGNDSALRYPSEIGPFAALAADTLDCWRALADITTPQDRVALFTFDEFAVPEQFELVTRAMVHQMVLTRPPGNAAPNIVRLDARDVPDMLELVRLTQPGPFGPRTNEIGRYYGIRMDGKLVAMTGERMRLPGFTEISAVCTDPAYRGLGYAAGLMNFAASEIVERGETPFLHVFSHNASAIALYETLGYVLRRALHLLVVKKTR
jgi:predicted GNAT family acetyltransferase